MTCSFKYDGKEFATKQQIVEYLNNKGRELEYPMPGELLVDENNSINAYEALKVVSKTSTKYKHLADLLLSNPSTVFNVNIQFVDDIKSKYRIGVWAAGKADYDDRMIYISTTFRGQVGADIEATILHEIIHFMTEYEFYENKDGEISKKAEELLSIARLEAQKRGLNFYGLTNIKEFMSEAFSDFEFIEFLTSIKLHNDFTLWDEFLEWVFSIVGLKIGTTAYEEAYILFQQIISYDQSKTKVLTGNSRVIDDYKVSFSANLGPIIEIDRPLYTVYDDDFVRRSMAASRPLISIRGFLNMELFRLPADHTNRKLVEVLSDKIELSNVLDIKINRFPDSESDSEFRAFYTHGLVYDGIYSPPAIYYPAGMDSDMRGKVILHEIMHAYTEGVLKADPKLLKPEEVKFVKQIDELFKLANGLAIRHNLDFYGLTNKSEFIAEAMTDPEFKQFLKGRKIKVESFNGSLWGYLIQILKELFTAGITEASLLDLTEKAVFDYLENKSNVIYIRRIDAESPNFLSVDYSQPIKNPSFVQYHGEEMFSKAVRDDETKTYKEGAEEYDSVTGKVLPDMQTRPFTSTDDAGTRAANAIWGTEDPSTEKEIRGVTGTLNKEEYIKLVNSRRDKAIAKGTIFHKIFHAYISNDPQVWGEINDLYTESGILKSELEWLDKKMVARILRKTGTNYFDDNPTDKLYTERTFSSGILKWAGTADLFIDHGDNVYSLYDIKTGKLGDDWEQSFLKYGRTSTEDIFDNARNRAKLQLMLYAFIIKTQNPNARFRNLELLHIRNQWAVDENDAKKNVNVKAFLEVIEGVLKHEKPKLYQALQALPHFKQLFDPTHYVTANKTDFESIHPNADPAMILRLKMLDLQSLIMYDQHIALKDDEGTAERKKKIAELMAEVMKLRSTSDMSYASWNTDMGWMDKWLGSPSYSTNPYVQLYYQMLSERKQKARDDYRSWRAKFETLLEKVLKDKRPLTTLIGGINSKDTFAWAYKKIKKGDGYTERFYTSKDAEWEKLTDAQRELLTFINESVGSMFVDKLSNYVDPRTGKRVALANRIVTYRKVKGKEVGITNLDLFNRSFDRGNSYMKAETFKYYDGFMPKEAPTMSDIIEEHGISGLPQILKFVKHRYLTNYFEANYEGMYSSEEAIPMKGLGSAYIDDNHLYTRNLEFSVDNFMKQSFYKQHLDEVYAYGKAMQIYLEAKANINQGVTFDRTIEWFEESVNLHILGHRQKEVEVSGRTFGRLKDNKYEQFNTIKFLRSVKNFFAGPTMWLKPLTSLPNAVFASLVTLKESIKNSSGLGGANTNFGLTDIAFGFAEAFKLYFWNGLSDRSFRRNKAYLLMEKFGYLPDSYDWYTRPNQLMTAKNRLFTSWAMLRFHSLPEEVISTAIFVAQLKSMKYTKEDGTISNMWDGYTIDKDANSNNEAIGTIKWIGGKRGIRKITNISDTPQYEDLMGLSTEEINSIKFLYEKMHGGYRIDERVSAEYYIMGEFILQLKKYMPSILKNIWASRGLRSTQGYFQEVEENGVKVLKWTPEVIEGRYRILLGMFFNYIGVKNDTNGEKGNKLLQWLGYHKDASYDWKTLSKTQKEDMYDFLLTWGMFMILIFGYNNLWDRDDDDTLKKLYGRISNDFAGNVYPLEIVKNVSNLMNPVATRKAYNTIESGTELMWSWMLYSAGYTDEALTREGRFRGSAKFQQNIHFLSAWHDLNSKIDNSEYLSNVLDQYYK